MLWARVSLVFRPELRIRRFGAASGLGSGEVPVASSADPVCSWEGSKLGWFQGDSGPCGSMVSGSGLGSHKVPGLLRFQRFRRFLRGGAIFLSTRALLGIALGPGTHPAAYTLPPEQRWVTHGDSFFSKETDHRYRHSLAHSGGEPSAKSHSLPGHGHPDTVPLMRWATAVAQPQDLAFG